jgi:hypothetical protein
MNNSLVGAEAFYGEEIRVLLAVHRRYDTPMTIRVDLPPDLERFVADEARAQGHLAADDFVIHLLRQAQRAKQQAELEAKLLEGVEALDRGEGRPMTAADWEALHAGLQNKFGEHGT